MYPNLINKAQFLFTIDAINYYLVNSEDFDVLAGWSFVSSKKFRTETKFWRSFAGVVGLQLQRWYSNHKYCSRCKHDLSHSTKGRFLKCDNCKFKVYPTIAPCVIVGVYNKDQLLLTKYVGREYRNYALVAGFVEVGETLEDTVKREVMEEVGLKVKNIQFYKSQPWPFTDTLLAGFFVQVDGADKITLQKDELSVGVWIKRKDIPTQISNLSLTGEMIEVFRTYK